MLFLAMCIFAIYNLLSLGAILWLYTTFNDKKLNSRDEIGIKKVEKENATITFVSILIAFCGVLFYAIPISNVFYPLSIVKGLGFAAIPSILVTSFITIAICEEITFRGLLLSVLEKKFKPRIANILQSFAFGLFNVFLHYSRVNLVEALCIFAATSLIGLYLGCIKQKAANGSILPGIISVGLAYTVAMWLIAFV